MNDGVNAALVIIAICLLASAPPLGMIVLGIAFASHRALRSRQVHHRSLLEAQRRQKMQRARILDFKALP